MEIRRDAAKIFISSLPLTSPSLEELGALYASLHEALEGKPSPAELNLDLSGLNQSNHPVVSLVLSAATLCKGSGVKLSFSNLSDNSLIASFKKLGLHPDGICEVNALEEPESKSVCLTAGEAVFKIATDMKKLVGFVGETFLAFLYFLRHPGKLDVRETLFYMDKSGADAIPIVILVCFLMGMILGFQGVVQLGRFGLESFVTNLVGLAIVRELGPIMVGMICIGRAGSAYAAELGTMKGAEEIDAITTMGLKPVRMLVIPKMVALLVAMPFLILIGDFAGIVGGVVIGTAMTDLTVHVYLLKTVDSLVAPNIFESLTKGFVFAFIIAAVGCFRGFEADRDAKGVGTATTSSVVTGIFLLVLFDFFVTFTFPQVMALIGIPY